VLTSEPADARGLACRFVGSRELTDADAIEHALQGLEDLEDGNPQLLGVGRSGLARSTPASARSPSRSESRLPTHATGSAGISFEEVTAARLPSVSEEANERLGL
jgi:hypothetical protein